MAAKVIAKISDLWRPNLQTRNDNLSLTPTRMRRNIEARTRNEEITFDPSVKTKTPLESAYRIFGENRRDHANAAPVMRKVEGSAPGQPVRVYTDGSCDKNGMSNAVAAYGLWFGRDDPRNGGGRVPGLTQSNQAAELYAIEEAVKRVNQNAPLSIVTDSRHAVDGLTKHLPRWEDRGWIEVKSAPLFRRVVAHLRSRTARTTFQWVKGHAGVEGNEGADGEARGALEGPDVEMEELDERMSGFLMNGVKLATVTQSLAYKAIRRAKAKPERPTTGILIQRTQATLERDFGSSPNPDQIWLRMRDKDLPRKIRDFMWKLAHGAHRVGKYWDNVRGLELRATCGVCRVEESMEHILFECDAPGPKAVWKMVRLAVAQTGSRLPEVSLGMVIGAPHIALKTGNDNLAKGPSRLAKILVTEAAHLVWKLRCERVIQWEGAKTHSITEIKARYWAAMNRRMEMDRSLALSRIAGRKPKRAIVEATWRAVLRDAERLPDEWIEVPGVLVGMLGQNADTGVG